MNIIFMGTPDFAEADLLALINSRHKVLAVVTQPDKPQGRKGILTPPPVKVLANEHGIPVFQPERVREEGFDKKLAAFNADICVVVAFGQIIPASILNMTKYGCINVHASLLPDYRGAAPIQWAVIDGEKETGVTVMQMDEGLDTGDILNVKKVAIAANETAGSLFDKLKEVGSNALLETLDLIEAGKTDPLKQGTPVKGYAKILKKSMGLIDFNKSAESLECFIRGMDPWPSAYTKWNKKTLKFWKAEVVEDGAHAETAVVTRVSDESFEVSCAEGCLKVLEVQLEGKKRMKTGDFLRGNELKVGDRFGE